MSAFEVSFTPTRPRAKRSPSPTLVTMAPFSAKSIVQFEDVPVTKTARRVLRVINESNEEIEVKVTKTIRPEHNVTIDWTKKLIPARSQAEMEMVWTPEVDIVCKETMQLTDNRNFRKDVTVILKSCSNKIAKSRKFPTLSSTSTSTSHVKTTMRLKSPTNAINHKRTLSNIQTQQRKKIEQKTETKTTTTTMMKKNVPKVSDKGGTRHSVTSNLRSSCTAPLTESNIAMRPSGKFTHNANTSPLLNINMVDISKENISPLASNNIFDVIDNLNFTPAAVAKGATFSTDNMAGLPTPVNATSSNVLNLIDDLNFTPATTAKDTTRNIDNLANLPTPVNAMITNSHRSHTQVRELRPRKLTAAELCDDPIDILDNPVPVIHVESFDVTPNKAHNSSTTTNKTFVVKPTEDVSFLHESLEVSAVALANQTTTILCTPMGRTLTMIKEEDDTSAIMEVTNKEVPNQDLKRDIKLVGTPLRKYSESMKNLSWKSPPGKIPIQGSMPNLNEMETIRSIEQNRYFHQSGGNHQQYKEQPSPTLFKNKSLSKGNQDKDLSSINMKTVSQVDLHFVQSEILAQSSRFNLDQIGACSMVNISPKTGAMKIGLNQGKNEKEKLIPKTAQKRSLYDCCEIQSTETLTQYDSLRVSGRSILHVSPPKRKRFDISGDHQFARPNPVNSSATRKNWSRTQSKNVAKLTKTLSLVKKPITPSKTTPQPRIKLYDSDFYLQTHINPDPFAATTTCDPFLASTMYLDEHAVELHQRDFRKWLNALVTIPEDLNVDSNTKIDVGKLFNEVRNKDLTLAPTKEEKSINYLTKFRLESLRRAAVELFFSEEMRVPCAKVAVYINKQGLRIRNDRNLHLDVVMQRSILELLLYFNPLWLRLGLEVVYGEKIHLNSNRDIIGLSSFILNRLFRDKFLEQKYSRAYTLSEEYAEHIKKFTLQKTLFLLLFLDKAKSKRIVKHNPCLFVKTSPYKETKDILLRFSSELLANIGDITRDLRRLGYTLQHKQNFLDEFDYAFNNLAIDLRDGVRLTRVMEIILLRDDLSPQLRVPAISRLQRIFNVNLALRALSEADFHLTGDITASDIVDGYREKTLSLLWQIIYNFRSPKFHSAARTIQIWWRHNWLRIVIRRRIQQKELQRKEKAAIKIQSLFRGFLTRRFAHAYKIERMKAAIVLQKYIRRFLVHKQLFKEHNAAIVIQTYYRAYLLRREVRQKFLRLRTSVVFIQRIFRRRLLSRKLLLLADEARRQREQKRNAAAAYIQSYWRDFCETRVLRTNFLRLRQQVLIVQQRYRALKQMQKERLEYLLLREKTVFIQRKLKFKILMRQERQAYLKMREVIVKLQRRRRSQLQMRKERAAYIHQRIVVIYLQRRVRAMLAMKKQREVYQRKKAAASIIQRRYRAHVAMKWQFILYQKIRTSTVIIQRKWRATILSRRAYAEFKAIQHYTIVLQQKYRARKLMHLERASFLQLCNAAIVVQRRFRANRQMLQVRAECKAILRAVITLQRRFRAYKQMRFQRAKYHGTRAAVLCLQQHVRAFLLQKRIRNDFLRLKKCTIFVQHCWRKNRAIRLHRLRNEQLRSAAITIQRRYRANLKMRKTLLEYNKERQLIVAMQRRWRAKLLARKVRQDFNVKRMAIITIQRRYRAVRKMRVEKQVYGDVRKKVILIQRIYRAFKLMQRQRLDYLRKRDAALHIQIWYRSVVIMRDQKEIYQRMRNSSILIQRKWRATNAARQQQVLYKKLKDKVLFVQRKFRAILAARKAEAAAIVLQRRYRARLQMLKIRNQYKLIISAVICVQRKFRQNRKMLQQRHEFLRLKHYTIHLQQKFRGKRLMEKESANFQLLRKSITNFQANARGVLARRRFQELLTPEMLELLKRKRAAKIIQRFYRGYCVRKRFRNTVLSQIRKKLVALKSASTVVKSLRYKLIESVRILRGRLFASEALNELQRLDRLSRTVPHLICEHSVFISTFCYGIMAQAIRSEVDKIMIELCSRIMLNLARVSLDTFQKDGLAMIAQILLRWCDKDCEIFNTLCTLIYIFAHSPEKRKIIRDYMTTPEAIYLLRETKKLVARKEKMKQNDRRKLTNGQQLKIFSPRALPSLEPDYGIINQKPYTFISSVYAFDIVLGKLGIVVH